MSTEQEQKKEDKEEVLDAAEKPEVKNISVEQVFSQYPIDRDKARDVLFMEISSSLLKISQSLEAINQGLVATNSHLAESNQLKKLNGIVSKKSEKV
jgi:hypothetical protein